MGRAFEQIGLGTYGAIRGLRNVGLGLILTILPLATVASAETVTIAALGDSLTQGYGLMQDDGFVPQLEGWLRAQGADVDVINAGVSGDTTAGGLSRVAWTLTPDVDVMIVALGGNDLLRGIDPAVSRSNLDGILQAGTQAQVDMLLVGMEAPLNYGADFKADFDAMYPDLAAQYGTAFYPAFFDGLTDNMDIETARSAFMQADGIHPNRDGVARIVAAIGPSVLALID